MRGKATSTSGTTDEESKVPASDSQSSGGDETGANIPVYIGNKLKALFEEVVSQPVPDHLLDLLKRLETGGRDD